MNPEEFAYRLIAVDFPTVLEDRSYSSLHFENSAFNYIALVSFYLSDQHIYVEVGKKFSWIWDYSKERDSQDVEVLYQKYIPKWLT